MMLAKRSWLRRTIPKPVFFAIVVLVCGVVVGGFELPYVNWHAVASPIDAHPLMIRCDAKGDGRFAARRNGRRRHRGIDLVAPLNSPVRAIRSGTVVQVGVHKGLGQFIELDHGQQLHSLYAHLSEVAIKPGARVRQGQVIGLVGKTGNARHPWITPHLHLEVLSRGEPIDPQTLGLHAIEPALSSPTMIATKVPTTSTTVFDAAGYSAESEDASGGE